MFSPTTPFQFGNNQIYLQANQVFLRQDDLIVAFQIYGLSRELKEKSELKFAFFKSGEEFRSITKKIIEYTELPNFIEKFPLREFLPAHYRLQVTLFVDGQEILFSSEEFDITHLEAIVRPWVYSKLLPNTENPNYSYVIGTQFFNSGKIAEAREHLERAFQRKQDSIDFAFHLARVYMASGEYKMIEPILLPFLNQPKPPSYDVFFIMGRAYQNTGELSKAIEFFDKAISHFGLNTNLLNAIGECYFQLGNAEEALAAWKKSLEMNLATTSQRSNS